MADASNSANPPAGANGQALLQPQVRVVSQYIKDLSFENPGVGKQILAQGENPNIQIEVNVNAQRVGDALFETAITLKANCSGKGGVLYESEVEYAGLFEARNLPEPALEQLLLVNGPAIIFPFLRRLVADVTREGGYPPLLLEPIDFGGLYLQRRQQAAQGGPTANA